MDDSTIQFSLDAPVGRHALEIHLRRAGERWVAETAEPGAIGIGSSPRAALHAALAPLGPRAVARLLADLRLIEPSLRVLELERSAIR